MSDRRYCARFHFRRIVAFGRVDPSYGRNSELLLLLLLLWHNDSGHDSRLRKTRNKNPSSLGFTTNGRTFSRSARKTACVSTKRFFTSASSFLYFPLTGSGGRTVCGFSSIFYQLALISMCNWIIYISPVASSSLYTYLCIIQ